MPWLLQNTETKTYLWPGGYTALAAGGLRFEHREAAEAYLHGLPVRPPNVEPVLVTREQLSAGQPGALPSYDPSGLRR